LSVIFVLQLEVPPRDAAQQLATPASSRQLHRTTDGVADVRHWPSLPSGENGLPDSIAEFVVVFDEHARCHCRTQSAVHDNAPCAKD
jgi:hypothetical protein